MQSLVIESVDDQEIAVDIFQKLSNNRIIFIQGFINDKMATDILATLLLKDAESNEKITLFINSEGGDIRSVFTIYDTFQILQSPIETVCFGIASNEAALLLAAGTPGLRKTTEHAAIVISQLDCEFSKYDNLASAKVLLDVFKSDNDRFLKLMAKHLNKKLVDVQKEFAKPKYLTSAQAKKNNIVDVIIGKNK
jgi:ATP-dependent Clp protease protease subunit